MDWQRLRKIGTLLRLIFLARVGSLLFCSSSGFTVLKEIAFSIVQDQENALFTCHLEPRFGISFVKMGFWNEFRMTAEWSNTITNAVTLNSSQGLVKRVPAWQLHPSRTLLLWLLGFTRINKRVVISTKEKSLQPLRFLTCVRNDSDGNARSKSFGIVTDGENTAYAIRRKKSWRLYKFKGKIWVWILTLTS